MKYLKKFNESFESDNIQIPSEFEYLQSELGEETTPNEIIELWNELVIPDTMGDTSKLVGYRNGSFFNEDGDELGVNAILDEINYSLSGGE
jgi:hypothetical protein